MLRSEQGLARGWFGCCWSGWFLLTPKASHGLLKVYEDKQKEQSQRDEPCRYSWRRYERFGKARLIILPHKESWKITCRELPYLIFSNSSSLALSANEIKHFHYLSFNYRTGQPIAFFFFCGNATSIRPLKQHTVFQQQLHKTKTVVRAYTINEYL